MKVKNKKSLGVQISDKDKNLIFLVGMVAVIFLGWQFLISPKYNDIKGNNSELESVKAQRDTLKAKYENIGNFKKERENLEYNFHRMKLRIPGYDSLQFDLSNLYKLATKNGMSIGSVNVSETMNSTPDQYTINSGNIQPGGVLPQKYIGGNNVTLSIGGSYESIYGFLKDVEESDRKFGLGTLQLEQASLGNLHGTMTLDVVRYMDTLNIEKCPYDIEQVDGKFDMFAMDKNASGKTKDASYYTPEYFMNINQSSYEGAKIAFMETGKFSTEVISKSDKETNGSIKISGSGENLTVSCKLGEFSRVINSKVDIKNNTIRINVLSSPRITPDDHVKLNLTLDNNTIYNVEVTVINDDVTNPKFVLKNPNPKVIVKGVTR